MKILGFYDGHNASAAIVNNGKISAVVEEERLSRIKFHDGRYDGLPNLCIEEVFNIAKIQKSEIDAIAVPLLSPFQISKRVIGTIISEMNPRWALFFLNNFGNWGPLYYAAAFDYQSNRKKRIMNFLKEHSLGEKKIIWTEHHTAHNASAYYMSNFKEDALAVSFDGKGDGLCGETMKCTEGKMTSVHKTPDYHSIALLYSAVTEYLGFRPTRHEGKITGLAAFANSNNEAYDIMKNYASFDNERIRLNLIEKSFVKPYPYLSTNDLLPLIKRDFDGKNISREKMASAIQRLSEELAVKYVSHWLEKTGVENVVLSGGLFANVKINKMIMEIPSVKSVFVSPGMSDSGLAVGAALYAYAEQAGLNPFEIKNVYFGPGYTDSQIEEELSKNSAVEFNKSNNIEKETADLIVDGKIVARFDGRLEYGPRALGNRSILYDPSDPAINKWLNDRLNRTEFMPFAPVALEEKADELYENYEKAKYSARFMTIAFDTTDFAKKNAAAVTHVDGTARPQLVKKEYNSSYYSILENFYKKTGTPCFVNTSFNMHEEPIVNSPYDAVRSFSMGRLDVLSIGNYIVTLRDNKKVKK